MRGVLLCVAQCMYMLFAPMCVASSSEDKYQLEEYMDLFVRLDSRPGLMA